MAHRDGSPPDLAAAHHRTRSTVGSTTALSHHIFTLAHSPVGSLTKSLGKSSGSAKDSRFVVNLLGDVQLISIDSVSRADDHESRARV